MNAQIKVEKPLVVLHGDEMAQIAFVEILERFVRRRLQIELVEIDLTAERRLLTNGQVVVDAGGKGLRPMRQARRRLGLSNSTGSTRTI